MRGGLITAVLLSISFAWADDPPKPNREDPVDYIAWMNHEYGKSVRPNAADIYRRAFGAFVVPSDNVNKEIAETGVIGELYLTDEDGPGTVSEWITAHKRFLRLFVEATRVEGCFFECESPTGMVGDMQWRHLSGFRTARILLELRACERWAEGDARGATEDLCTILRAARHLYSLPTLVEWRRGTSLSRWVYRRVRSWMSEDVLRCDVGCLGRLLTHLLQDDRPIPVPRAGLLEQKLMAWDTFQRHVDDPEPRPLFETQADFEVALLEVERFHRKFHRLFLEDYAKAKIVHDALADEFEHMREEMDPTRVGEVTRTVVKLLVSIVEPVFWRDAQRLREIQAGP